MLCFICVVSVKYRRDCRECWAHHKKYSGGKGFTPAFTGRSIPPPPPRPYVTQHNKISSGGSISGGISGERETEGISFNIGIKFVFSLGAQLLKSLKAFTGFATKIKSNFISRRLLPSRLSILSILSVLSILSHGSFRKPIAKKPRRPHEPDPKRRPTSLPYEC